MPITRDTEENKRMKVSVLTILMAFLLAAGIPFGALAGPISDIDSDTVPDISDNCSTVANAGIEFCDVDSDGYGNACDADTDNDGGVGISDFTTFSNAFKVGVGGDPLADFDCDGAVGISDFTTFSNSFKAVPPVPGPSGLSCAGTIPCP
jgi:hypothetical protein